MSDGEYRDDLFARIRFLERQLEAAKTETAKLRTELEAREMRPDWNNAPPWARALSQDANGSWHWHEFEPRSVNVAWVNRGSKTPAYPRIEWRDTAEKRPETHS